jgi:hypothetical protein
MKISSVADAGEVHPNPFVGPVNHTVALLVDVSTLTTDEVDNYGYLKPGVILQANGDKITGASQIAYGAVVEAVQVAPAGSDDTALAAITTDVEVAVGLFVLLNRDILEDSLGRVLSANELAAIDVAGSHVAITPT